MADDPEKCFSGDQKLRNMRNRCVYKSSGSSTYSQGVFKVGQTQILSRPSSKLGKNEKNKYKGQGDISQVSLKAYFFGAICPVGMFFVPTGQLAPKKHALRLTWEMSPCQVGKGESHP